jgi:uncharacterized protein (TIGR02147 family)
MNAVYLAKAYKTWVIDQIEANKGIYGYQTQLAAAAGCQRSYLSQALRGKPHLTVDQLIGIAQFCGLSNDETSYLLDLHSFEKANTVLLKNFYQQRLERGMRRYQDVGKRIKKTKVKAEEHSLFYSNWIYGAIYTCTLLEKARTPAGISQKLLVPLEFVQKAMQSLLDAGLLLKKDGQYSASNSDIHLSKDSPFLPIHLKNWRERAVEHASLRSQEPSVHFSAVYTLAKRDYEKLMEHYLQIIELTRKTIMSSKDETEVVCFNLDWFKVSV